MRYGPILETGLVSDGWRPLFPRPDQTDGAVIPNHKLCGEEPMPKPRSRGGDAIGIVRRGIDLELLFSCAVGFAQKEITWNDLSKVSFVDKYFPNYGEHFLYPTFSSSVKALEGKKSKHYGLLFKH
jgi:hypothetical protein